MRKRIFSCLILCFFLFCSTAFAAEQRVFDDAGLLSAEEIAEAEAWCADFRENWDMDLAFLTTNGTNGEEIEQFAAQFFLQNHMGVGENQDGVIFVMDMAERDGRIITHGMAIDIYTDYYIDKLWDHMVGYLSDGEYADAFYCLYNDLDYYAGEYQKYLTDPNYVSEYAQDAEDLMLARVGIAVIVGLIVAFIRLQLLKRQMDNVRPFTDGRAYLAQNGYQLSRDQCNYAGSHVTKVPIPRDDDNHSSWGGSSTTFSSGGSKFGGSGGKF